MGNFTGTSGNDVLTGTSGDDTLDGKGGNDILIGLLGNDSYYVDTVGDNVREDLGGGSDRIYASADYDLRAGQEIEILSTDWNQGTAAIALGGNELANSIYGNAGNNVLNGKGGYDILIGLGGNDSYYVDSVGDNVGEDIGGGNDRVYASADYTLRAGQEIETLSTDWNQGTAAIALGGNEFANNIYGNAGNNILDGKGGNDILIGLGGDDNYYVDTVGDNVSEAVGGGNDRVYASADYTLRVGQEIETLSTDWNQGTAAIALGGNEFANNIYGNAGNNILDGKGGNDILIGLGGNDNYYVDTVGDNVSEAVGGGNDRVYASADYTLRAGQEIETLSTDWNQGTAAIALGGNEFANNIYGNAGNNILDGKGGSDVLVGLGGDDNYYVDTVGDNVSEAVGGGNDRVYASADYTLRAGQEIEILSTDWNQGTAAIALGGNELVNSIYGNAGNNILDGKGGNDVLIGGGGTDTFAFTSFLGSTNVDTIVDFEASLDTIQLAGATGQPFEAMATGIIRAGVLRIGSGAVDADDYIIYNSATGALLYDDDGNGAHSAVQFATLSPNLNLTIGNFNVSGPAGSAPVITSAATATTAENGAPNSIVYQATATDADGDRIIYSLLGPDAGYLTIDPVSGTVRLNNPADFETKNSYQFIVVAGDSGDTNQKLVTLTITDVTETTSTPIINETAATNDTTGQAQALDRNIFNVSVNPDLPNQALPSATIHGAVSTDSDADFYSITLQAGEQIILDIDHTTGALDSFIRFYGSNGVEIVNNDDRNSGDPGSNPPFDHNTDSYLTYRVATSGTYYFSVEAFGDLNNDQEDDGKNVGESSGSYSLNVSIGPPANAAQIMDEDIDALISGSQWDHVALTYGFPTDTSQYPSGIKEITPASDFSPFTAAQQSAASQLLQLVANVSSLTFQQLSANPGSANIRYAMSSEADVAYAYYPTNQPNSVGGTAWFNKTDFNNPVEGNYAWMGILHETGHTLGLKHGHEAPAVSSDHDSLEYTVMTYRSFPGDDLNGYTNEQWGYPQSLMMLDIAALQRIYGANFTTNSGNTVYSWSPSTGEMSIDGAPQGAPGNGAGPSANRVFMTVWDGGGNDTYDLSGYSSGSTIDLRPGEWTTTSATQLASLGSGHTARGNVANALLYQGNIASLIENAIGGSGGNTLIANQAANHLTGNGGSDTFKWMAGTDAGTGALADTIMDFVRGSDKIDLTNVDANSNTGAQDTFHFVGTAAFSNTAGELRYDVTGGNAHIFGDRDGNGVADMEIIVNNVTVLATTDFNGVTSGNATVPAAPEDPGAADTGIAGNGATIPGSANLIGVAADNPHFFADLSGGGPAYVAAMHNVASLHGPEFYF